VTKRSNSAAGPVRPCQVPNHSSTSRHVDRDKTVGPLDARLTAAPSAAARRPSVRSPAAAPPPARAVPASRSRRSARVASDAAVMAARSPSDDLRGTPSGLTWRHDFSSGTGRPTTTWPKPRQPARRSSPRLSAGGQTPRPKSTRWQGSETDSCPSTCIISPTTSSGWSLTESPLRRAVAAFCRWQALAERRA
jgi:hypothetical protein